MMRIYTALAGLALATSLPADAVAQDDQVAELTEARAIIETAFPPPEREQTFATIVTQMVDQIRGSMSTDSISDPQLSAILDRYMDSIPERLAPAVRQHLPQLFEANAIAYTNAFTLEELRDIRAFAESPSGKRFLQNSASLISDPAVAAANTEYFKNVQAVQATLQSDLMQELSAYLIENPEAATQFLGAVEP